ncbi:hypothetical protein BDEG_24809 [Batrachochytrium dendrobatidis JEL423]|nr:hypothetical protein BDEG_24809 [Batrachochytrium dendrobatidis JEL423]
MAVENQLGIEFTPDMLHALQNLLTIAEDSSTRGDAKAIYESKKNLAQYFLLSSNYNMAISYFRETLDAAAGIKDDPMVEIEATLSLGHALEKSEHVNESIECYENTRKLAASRNNLDGEIRACQHLVSGHTHMAESFEYSGDYDQAIFHYTKCLEYLTHPVYDEMTISDIEFRLGKVHKDIGQIETAIKYLERFVAKPNLINDKSRQGWAQASLASCYESAGNPQLAASYLQQFISAAESDPIQRVAVSQACNQLGMLFNKMGQFELAVTYFERHFQLMTEISKDDMQDLEQNTHQLNDGDGIKSPLPWNKTGSTSKLSTVRVGGAQTQLGISKGNAQMAQYFETIVDCNGLASLLLWKAKRSFGSYLPTRLENI